MTREDENVKVTRWAWCRGRCRDLLQLLDSAPRLGWYIAFVSTANFLVLLLK